MTALEFLSLGLQRGDHVHIKTTYGGPEADCVFYGLRTFASVVTDPNKDLAPEFRTIGKRGGMSREVDLPGTRFEYIESVTVLKKKEGTPLGSLRDSLNDSMDIKETIYKTTHQTILHEMESRGILSVDWESVPMIEEISVDDDKILTGIEVKDHKIHVNWEDEDGTKDWWPVRIIDERYLKKILIYLRGIIMLVDTKALAVDKSGEVIQKHPD